MSVIKSGRIWRPGLFFLTLFPGWAIADLSAANSTSLVLEVRYCECAVVKADDSQAAVLPGFFAESTLLKTDVSESGSGQLTSDSLTLYFEVGDVQDASGNYRFTYSGSYVDGSGETESQADLVVTEGQWFPLVQTEHDSAGNKESFGLAARLVDARGL